MAPTLRATAPGMPRIMKPARPVGIMGYGAYIPRYRVRAAEIARVWRGGDPGALPVKTKSVPGPDEDVVTMSIEACANALARAEVDARLVRAVYVGSESHPYAVKPTGTIVAEALGVGEETLSADFEFACKAGTEAMQAATAIVGSGMADYALAVGMDTAQGRPGDVLEYTAGAGGAAFLMGPAEGSLAVLEGSYSIVSDTPDFFRRAYAKYPEHAGRFTGEPAYFRHLHLAATGIMDELGLGPHDFEAIVCHQPNAKFPRRAAKKLGFVDAQIDAGLLATDIGNTYAGASPLGFTRVLDQARPGGRVLIVSFGSGAGSDAMVYRITDNIETRLDRAPRTQAYLDRAHNVDYATYARWRKKVGLA